MSSDGFARIARERAGLRAELARLERYLALRSVGVAVRTQSAADFVRLAPDVLEAVLDELVDHGVLEKRECWICPRCNAVIEGDEDEGGRRECDECQGRFSRAQAEHEVCYFLRRPIVRGLQDAAETRRDMEQNPLRDEEACRLARIVPWKNLQQEDYTISITTFHPGPRDQALGLLQKYGIVRLRWQGDPPTPARLESLQNWVGPARSEQNDYKGKVKSLRPDYDVAPNTGDSAKALPPHVDGTQDERTPGILAFQYDLSATWGAESTFIDMAAVLRELPGDELERILTALSRKDCATCTKKKGEWTKTFNGPLVRSECSGHSVSIRLREDELLHVIPECQTEFEALKAAIAEWDRRHKILYTPQEGDVVIFDNWRVLHGRAAIGGRHQRIHDRMWIDRLLPEHDGKYLIGIRPLGHGLMDAIERENAR